MVLLNLAQGQQKVLLLLVRGAVAAAPVVTALELSGPAEAWRLVLVWMPVQGCYLFGGQVGGLVEEVQVGQAHQVLVVQEPSFCIFYQYTPLLTFHLLPPLKTALSPP